SRQAERLREIAEHRSAREFRRGAGGPAVIDRVIDLVDDELDTAPLRELVERADRLLADEGAARVVRRVHENQTRARVAEAHDLLGIERETVLESQRVTPRLDAERGRNLEEWRERRRRHDDVPVRIAADEEQREQSLGPAVEDDDLLGVRAIHR